MPGTIVVGYDGSDHGSDALALGRLLRELLDGELAVVCAYPDDPLGESATAVEIAKGMQQDAEAKLERARELCADEQRVEYRAVAGATPARVLHELGEQLEAAAIVVGASHHGTALRLLTGSTPEHVLDHAPCPVAVAPAGFAGRSAGVPQQIGVAYDGSPEADHALAVAAGLARATGAQLRLVSVVNAAGVGLYPPLDVTSYEQIGELARERARQQLDAAVAGLDGVAADGVVLEGDPVEVLIEDSATEGLLVTGSRAHGPFRRVLLGSISTRLLRRASCPVVVVPRGSGEGP
ncbi:MAG TPA: universal stress protein [Conexibacter sp.]|nr:universal stress protein [Conexibacter sp.]